MEEEKKKVGRPRKNPVRHGAGENLPEEWTRATFIVRKDLLERLKDYQNTSEYRTMKELMDDMITSFLTEKEGR